MPKHLRLISHKICPYVQRAAIIAREKGIEFERVDIDLANKPDWFLKLSPTGKVPVLEVIDEDGSHHVLFESAVIAEYLDEIGAEGTGARLLPADPLARARERAWVEFASAALGDIYRLTTSPEQKDFDAALADLSKKVDQLEKEVAGPWFAGDRFGLVDAAFAPVLRYFDVFEKRAGLKLLDSRPNVAAWGKALLERPSVIHAVPENYFELLTEFVRSRGSHFASKLEVRELEAA